MTESRNVRSQLERLLGEGSLPYIPTEFLDYMADYATLNGPPIPISQVMGYGLSRGARVYSTTDQALTSGATTAINFDSARFDDDTMHDSSAPSRLTVRTDGTFMIFGTIRIQGNATGNRLVSFRVNGGTDIAAQQIPAPGVASAYLSISTIWKLTKNDYVEMDAFQDSGVSLNSISQASIAPEFGAIRVGA